MKKKVLDSQALPRLPKRLRIYPFFLFSVLKKKKKKKKKNDPHQKKILFR